MSTSDEGRVVKNQLQDWGSLGENRLDERQMVYNCAFVPKKYELSVDQVYPSAQAALKKVP